MNANEYRQALDFLGLDHDTVEPHLGICSRTSYRYAKNGAPEWIALLLGWIMRAHRQHPPSASLAQAAEAAD